jgi:hypothetical protein
MASESVNSTTDFARTADVTKLVLQFVENQIGELEDLISQIDSQINVIQEGLRRREVTAYRLRFHTPEGGFITLQEVEIKIRMDMQEIKYLTDLRDDLRYSMNACVDFRDAPSGDGLYDF